LALCSLHDRPLLTACCGIIIDLSAKSIDGNHRALRTSSMFACIITEQLARVKHKRLGHKELEGVIQG
jgi:hypothetical protein